MIPVTFVTFPEACRRSLGASTPSPSRLSEPPLSSTLCVYSDSVVATVVVVAVVAKKAPAAVVDVLSAVPLAVSSAEPQKKAKRHFMAAGIGDARKTRAVLVQHLRAQHATNSEA